MAIEPQPQGMISFRAKLLVGMMAVVTAITALAIYFAQRSIASDAELEMKREFQSEIASLHRIQELRHAALAERWRALLRRPRIHAALEDNALDLLYLSARDELHDVMLGDDAESLEPVTHALHARYYRFLDGKGALIPPAASANEAGLLNPEDEAQLALSDLPAVQQSGYLFRKTDAGLVADEIIAMPIVSTETGEVISALVLGFKPAEPNGKSNGIKSGFLVNERLHMPELSESAQAGLRAELLKDLHHTGDGENSLAVNVEGVPHLLFFKKLNPGSLFPPAYEVSIFPLSASLAHQKELRWQIAGAGLLLLLGGLVASHFMSARLSVPVEKLAVDSEEHRTQRVRAEATLQIRNVELQRSVRFSADASHQLKTPVTVLRAGLEELLARHDISLEMRNEIAALIHQTFKLTGMIEDLLLLSRMDAGRLQLDFAPVDLTLLLESLMDDLSALPDELELTVETAVPLGLTIAGEKGYTALLLQNILENARKYNRKGGVIRVVAQELEDRVILKVGNNGHGIPKAAQEHIFERFHRANVGEKVPGHGLGLNLARELALIHGGDLQLVSSSEDWTEFEIIFRSYHSLAHLASEYS